MRKLNLLFVFLVVISIVSCIKKPNIELIVGSWEVKEGKIENVTNLYFGIDKRFKMFDGTAELESEDHIEYRIINEKDLIDYPNFTKEENNGKIILLVGIEKNGNIKGFGLSPFEIISLTKNELRIKCIQIQSKNEFYKLCDSEVTLERIDNKHE